MNPDALKARLSQVSPGTQVEVTDLTGTHDHYQVRVVSGAFAGKTTMERHRMMMDLVRAEIDSGELHALTLKTHTPEELKK